MLFLQGGAIGENAIVPMNLLRGKTRADYVDTGDWSKTLDRRGRALLRQVNVAASARGERLHGDPGAATSWRLDPDAAYVHICAERDDQRRRVPLHARHRRRAAGRRHVVATSCRGRSTSPRYGLIYGGAQKNIGPAGLTIVIVRDDLIGQAQPSTPSAFDYQQQAANDSMLNTPPTYAIYIAGLVFDWIAARGGLAAMAEHNRAKAALLYDYLDRARFYRNPVARGRPLADERAASSCKDPALDAPFLEGARRRAAWCS